MLRGPRRGRFPHRGPAAGLTAPAHLVRRPRIRGGLGRRGSGRRAASRPRLLSAPVVKIKFRIRNEARCTAAPPAHRSGGPGARRDGAGVGPAGRGPARRGAGAAGGTGGSRLARLGLQGTVPAHPGPAHSGPAHPGAANSRPAGRPAVAAGAGPRGRAVRDCWGRAGLRLGFWTVPAPTPGRRAPVRGGRFSGGLPGPAGAGPVQARLLWRGGQVAVHARPTGRHRTPRRYRPAGRYRTITRQWPSGRYRRVAAASPATIGWLVGRRPFPTPGGAVGMKFTRPAGLLTGCCGPPAPPGARLACATRIASARIPPGIVRSARGGRRVTPPALVGVNSPSLARGCLARRGRPGVTRHLAWGGGACVAAGPVAWCTGRSVTGRRLTRAAGPARGRLPGCAGPVVAARHGRPRPPMGRVVPGCLRIPGSRPPARAGHYLGVLRRRVGPPGQLTGVPGSGIDRATRPPPTRRFLRALVGHLSPCRASAAILPDRESPHHGAWQRRLPPGLARSSTRAGTSPHRRAHLPWSPRMCAETAAGTAVKAHSRPRWSPRGNGSARPP